MGNNVVKNARDLTLGSLDSLLYFFFACLLAKLLKKKKKKKDYLMKPPALATAYFSVQSSIF